MCNTCLLRCRDAAEAAAERARHLCLETYGHAPAVRVTGDTAAHLPYVWGHLDYILFELLKNSLRAVVEQQLRVGGSAAPGGALPPVTVRICQAPEAITIQISDRGGGLLPEVRDAVWQYGFTTSDDGDSGGDGGGGARTHCRACMRSVLVAASRTPLHPTRQCVVANGSMPTDPLWLQVRPRPRSCACADTQGRRGSRCR